VGIYHEMAAATPAAAAVANADAAAAVADTDADAAASISDLNKKNKAEMRISGWLLCSATVLSNRRHH
jgi:hypothetical protein